MLSQFAQSQDSLLFKKTNKFGLEVLLNPTTTLNKLVSAKDFSFANFDKTYLVGLKLRYKHHVLRTSIGLNTYSNKNNPLPGDPDITTTYRQMDARIGYEYVIRLNRRWNCGLGIDIARALNDSSKTVISSFDNIAYKNAYNAWGIGPVINLQYHLNRFLSASVESFGYLYWYQIENTSKFKLLPELNTSIKSSGTKFNWTPPVCFFLILKL
jgi:hypothetical protein